MRIAFPKSALSFGLFFIRLCGADWANTWDAGTRTLDSANEVDPYDGRSTMRGNGEITMGSGTCIMKKSPRLYVSASPEDDARGFDDVEFTAYGKFASVGAPKSYSGLTLVARSNHSAYMTDGCAAAGYYARLYLNTGEASFQKEYYHSGSGGGTVYTASNRVPVPEFQGGLPLNQWIGMKFVVRSTGPGTDSVLLELWLDKNDDGTWELAHSLLDEQDTMPALKTVPSECTIQSGDAVLGPRQNCFLRSDGMDLTTEVHWRDAAIKAIDPTCRTGIPRNAACCAASCGTCGGLGCGSRPGGSSACCGGNILTNADVCAESLPPCRLVQNPGLCQDGIQNGGACCASSCGTCDGSACSGRPGGVESCCPIAITSNTKRTCDRYPPPCLL